MEEQRHLRDRPTSRATEVAQQIFLRADPALAPLRDEFSSATWLHRIAVTRALNHRSAAAEKIRRASEPWEGMSGEEIRAAGGSAATGSAAISQR